MRNIARRTFHMTGSRSGALEMARGRLVIISAVFILAYLILALRAFDLSIIQGELQGAEERLARAEHSEQKTPYAGRGDIVDRNGILLARSIQTVSLYADPKLIEKPDDVAHDLQTIFADMSYGDLLQKLQSNNRFVWIKRNITPDDHHQILLSGHPGLQFKTEMRRIYPHGDLASHLLGYTSLDMKGLSGVEGAFDTFLTSKETALHLTVDVRLQHGLRKAMAGAVQKHKAKGAAGIVMDVTNGEILAAVSLPDFDPHRAGQAIQKEKFNRYALGVYEPGSTFKIFSTAALLESNNSLSQRFDAREPIKVGRHTINDFHAEKRVLTLPEVFMHSSNIGSALMGQKVGTERLKSFYKDLGLLKPSDLELLEKGKPLIPDPWREVNTLTASFGHGIAVSPVQLVAAASSIVNGGLYITPTMILPHSGLQNASNAESLRIVSPQTAHRMRQLLRLVVTDGTGSKADVKGYEVGGKTGTAEKIGPDGYDSDRLISSFLGVFPASEPRYAVYVMVDEPKGTKETFGFATGGWVAAPTVAQVIEHMAVLLKIPPQSKDKNIAAPLKALVKSKDQIEAERKAALASY